MPGDEPRARVGKIPGGGKEGIGRGRFDFWRWGISGQSGRLAGSGLEVGEHGAPIRARVTWGPGASIVAGSGRGSTPFQGAEARTEVGLEKEGGWDRNREQHPLKGRNGGLTENYLDDPRASRVSCKVSSVKCR